MAKITWFPFKVIQITFRTIGILFCLCYIAISTSRLAAWLSKKQTPKRTFAHLDIASMQLPELGKKLQQSFK